MGSRETPAVNERFRAVQVLRSGHRVETSLGEDLEGGGKVIIKTIEATDLSKAATGRWKYEVQRLQELDRGASKCPIALVEKQDFFLVVRAFVPGATLEERLREGTLSVRETVSVGLSALAALEPAHRAGIVHRNIKPSNLIAKSAPAGGFELVDFGTPGQFFVQDPERPPSVESVFYLSPEQCGLIGGLDGRSDLYALGVVLYECLSGRPPFRGTTLSEVLRQHLSVRPPPLDSARPDVPRALQAIVERLLRKDPRDRYQSARGAIADLEVLAESLDQGIADPELVIGEHDRRRALTEPAFIGRTEELKEIEEALTSARSGRGGLAFVEAESGGGKTWFLEELRRRALTEGVWVLRGQAFAEGARRPYQVLSEIAGEALSRVEQEPELREAITESVSDPAAACEALPPLRRVFTEPAARPLDLATHTDARRLMALSSFLSALGSGSRPALVLIDDAQWADEPTLRLLRRWQAAAEVGSPRHVLVVVAFRSEETLEGHPLRAIEPATHIPLPPFGAEDARRQVASMAGDVPEKATAAVLEHAGGNPFLVTATLLGLVEGGALTAEPDGWRLDPRRLTELQSSERAGNVLVQRLDTLPKESRRLFAAAAILGRTFDPAVAAHLAGMETEEAVGISVGARGLVWADPDGTSFTFLHDRIREALLMRMSEDEQRRLHRAAAVYIERSSPTHIFDLAYHYDAAGETERAFPFALEAADTARDRFALDVAERFYRIAAQGADDGRVRFRIAKELGAILTLANRHEEAAAELTRALELSPSEKDRADVEEWWGMLETARGNLSAACEHSEESLRLIGRKIPERKLACLLSFFWQLLIQLLHTLFPRLFVGRRTLGDARAEEELLAARLYNDLQVSYFFARGYLWVMWAHLRALNLAERYPPTLELGHAYGNHGPVTCAFPRLFERGLRLTDRGARLCEERSDPLGLAWALTFHGTLLHGLSRFQRSLEVCRKAWHLFEEAGDQFRAETNLMMIGMSYFRLGDLKRARETAELMQRRGETAESQYSLAWAIQLAALANEGRVSKERIEREVERSKDNLQSLLGLRLAEALRLLSSGSAAEAAELLEATLGLHRRTMRVFNELNAPLTAYLVTALRLQAEAAAPHAPNERRRLLRRAQRASRRALKVARGFRNNLPHVLRERAHLSAMAGRAKAARRFIDESIAVAESLGAELERALSEEARARIGLALGWPGAEEGQADAAEKLRVIREEPTEAPGESSSLAVTLSLVDRFATVLEAGRRVATALTPEAIFSELDRACRALLRAEHCVILERTGGEGDPQPVYGDAGLPRSPRLIEEAIEEGRLAAEPGSDALADPEPADETLRRAATRSALCAPIRVRGRIFGCLYAAHGDVRGLFGDEEQRIGEYLAALAGAALENAEGFAEVEAFSRELEARVEERTAELLQANKMAAIGTLVAGLSHELNNPLGVILGYVQTLLRHGSNDDFTRGPLQAVERQTLRCRQLVRALLDFSRQSAREAEKISPRELLESIASLVESEARTREVVLDTAIDGAQMPEILGSRQELESALLNLINNAFDAAPKGSTVTVSLSSSHRDERSGVLITVSDRGPGIPSGELGRVFDPFFTTKEEGKGTGLGLSITRQIVEHHNGQIDVQTQEGAGTDMRVWLPALGERAAVASSR